MQTSWLSLARFAAVTAIVMALSLAAAGSLGSGEMRAARKPDLDPADAIYMHPDQIKWVGREGVSQTATLVGDTTKPGLYVQLIKWYPHNMSHPHFHTYARYITVLSGTWWVGTGSKFDPDSMVPMPAGSYVEDLPKGIHYDGAKDEPAVIEIVGEGPVTMTPAETK